MSDKTALQTRKSFQSVSVSGPLPSAAELAGYEKTLPGAAERILALTEKETAHRHASEDKLVSASLKQSGRGQTFAFIISLAAIALVLAGILREQPLASIAPAIIAITGLASLFTTRKKQ